jgi:hypothetical protein
MRKAKQIMYGSLLLAHPPHSKLTHKERAFLAEYAGHVRRGGQKKHSEAMIQQVLFTVDLASKAGYAKSLEPSRKNLENAFQVAGRICGLTENAVAKLYKLHRRRVNLTPK